VKHAAATITVLKSAIHILASKARNKLASEIDSSRESLIYIKSGRRRTTYKNAQRMSIGACDGSPENYPRIKGKGA
jgi:hypothetical protein